MTISISKSSYVEKIIFMGSPDFAVPSLQMLIESCYEIVAVYTQPPKPKGRGYEVQKTPVHLLAEAHGIPVFTPTSLKTIEAKEIFASHHADIAIVAAYGLILPREILNQPRLGCINIHASLLPRFRGAAPIQRAIMAQDPQTGITLMYMDEGLDTGDMYFKSVVPITEETTTPMLHDALAASGAALLNKHIKELLEGALVPVAQPLEGVVYAPKIKKEEGLLEFHKHEAAILAAHIRALNPWPGTWFNFHDIPIKVHKGSALDLSKKTDNIPALKEVGSFVKIGKDELCVVCKNQTLLKLELLQRPGGKVLSSKDFLAGFRELLS